MESVVLIFSFLSPSLRLGFISFWVFLTWLQRWWMARLLGYCKWDATFSMLWGVFWWYVGLKRNSWTSCNVLDIVSFVAIKSFPLHFKVTHVRRARTHTHKSLGRVHTFCEFCALHLFVSFSSLNTLSSCTLCRKSNGQAMQPPKVC